MINVSYKKKVKLRKSFLQKYNNEDFACLANNSKVLISVPHAVSQVRLGRFKVAEIGTLPIGLLLAEDVGANLIVKTKNNNDDANFDEKSAYRDKIKHLISACGVNYIFDIHGMKRSRECDVNLGVNLGNNIKTDEKLFCAIEEELIRAGFSVQIDVPFMAKERTISGFFAREYGVFALQIEVNCGLTNQSCNNQKVNLLVEVLSNVIKKHLKLKA